MGNGDIAMNIETMYSFDVESVSVRQGCTLTIFSGKFRCPHIEVMANLNIATI